MPMHRITSPMSVVHVHESSPSRARGLAVVAVVLLLVGLVGLPAAGQDQAPGDIDQVVDITFPLSGENYYSDTYDACRSGCSRRHRATDLMADKMVPIHAVVDGEICYITGMDEEGNDEPAPAYGYMIRLCGDDGLRYSYVHINNDTPGTDDGQGGVQHAYAPGILDGVRVARGQHIAWVGDSGNAESTGSHLHFEIYDSTMSNDEGRINPYNSLVAAEERGDGPTAPGEAPTPPAPDAPSEDPTEPSNPAEPSDPGDGDDEPGVTATVPRLAGADRTATAVALSRAAWSGESRAVLIVPAGSHVEALVAAPLAGHIDSPILLSGPDGLSPTVAEEVERLDPLSAYVIGGSDVLGEQVMDDLADAGVRNLARIEGDDRYELSAAVAAEIASYPDMPEVEQVILALGDAEEASRAWPDALSASALAAHTATPVLLTEGDRLPDAVADFLTDTRPDEVIVVGGTAAIREDVAEEAAALAGGDLTRLSGQTRYATSAVVAQAARDAGLRADDVLVATGLNYPDALAAGPAAARMLAPLVLVDGLNPDGAPESVGWLLDNSSAVTVVGGTAVVTDEVAHALMR